MTEQPHAISHENETLTFEIKNMHYRDEPDHFCTRRQGYYAEVTLGSGHTLMVSQLEGEAPQWGMDAAIGPKGEPLWVHSFGERAGLRVRGAIAPIAKALNAERDAKATAALKPE
ncbi:hypothetical protein [Nocardia heshunensis]